MPVPGGSVLNPSRSPCPGTCSQLLWDCQGPQPKPWWPKSGPRELCMPCWALCSGFKVLVSWPSPSGWETKTSCNGRVPDGQKPCDLPGWELFISLIWRLMLGELQHQVGDTLSPAYILFSVLVMLGQGLCAVAQLLWRQGEQLSLYPVMHNKHPWDRQ